MVYTIKIVMYISGFNAVPLRPRHFRSTPAEQDNM
jgi:hypothetical protein